MFLRDWSSAARYGGPGIVLGLALAWSLGGQRGVQAQGAAPAGLERARPAAGPTVGEAGGVLAMISAAPPGSSSPSGQLLYLIDTKSRSFAVYRIDPAHPKGTIKLEGARQFQWDMRLEEYNNQEPLVNVIASAVKAAAGQSR